MTDKTPALEALNRLEQWEDEICNFPYDGVTNDFAVIRAALQPVSADPMRHYSDQPIETAKTDGTEYIVWAAPAYGLPGFVTIDAYHPDVGWCVDELRPVTHWLYEIPKSVSAEPVGYELRFKQEMQPTDWSKLIYADELERDDARIYSVTPLYISPPDQSARIRELEAALGEARQAILQSDNSSEELIEYIDSIL